MAEFVAVAGQFLYQRATFSLS